MQIKEIQAKDDMESVFFDANMASGKPWDHQQSSYPHMVMVTQWKIVMTVPTHR